MNDGVVGAESQDVIVAGAGPVGLALGLGLARAGLRVHVLEALPSLSTEARASTIHPPTLEMFDEWGIIDDVLARGRRIDRLQFWERSTQALIANLEYRLIGGDTPYPFRLQCPQSTVTRIMLSALERQPSARVSMEHAVTGVVDRGTHVEVAVRSPAGERVLSARYVVGADGSKSQVRASLGLGFSGRTYPDRFLLVSTDLDPSDLFPGLGPVAYVFDPDEWVILMQLPDVLRVVFRLKPEEDEVAAREESAARARIQRFLGDRRDFTILGASTYSVHQRVTERFRVGNVLLAGDAAHVNNPAGGMGMNSGVHDAHALAAALVQSFKTGDESALDRYAETRRAAAALGVQQVSDGNYRDLVASEAREREARDRALRAAADDPAKARAYLLRASMIEARA